VYLCSENGVDVKQLANAMNGHSLHVAVVNVQHFNEVGINDVQDFSTVVQLVSREQHRAYHTCSGTHRRCTVNRTGQSLIRQSIDQSNQSTSQAINQSAVTKKWRKNVPRYVVVATKPALRLQIRPNSAQLEGSPYHSPTYIRVHAVSVGMRQGTVKETHKRP